MPPGPAGEAVKAPAEHAVDLLVDLCHGAAVAANWWVGPSPNALTSSGPMEDYLEHVRLGTRFGKALLAEKKALIHSEVSESLEGLRKNKMDEHCREFTSDEVELADTIIRICDYAGARRMRLGAALVAKMAYNEVREDHKPAARAAAGGKAF